MEPLPPYRRIVEDIRRRIADGELAPGDRVPSARQLRDQWGVALATATKALTTLRQEGLVLSRPRTATIVASPPARRAPAGPTRRRPPRPDEELTRERIIAAAIAIADDEGLDALTMRGVAARLGVATMSTYRHVSGKDQLIVLMADASFGELSYPRRPPAGWRTRLELGARILWALYRRHPWLAQLSPLIRPLPLANLLAHAEWGLHALDGLGLKPAAMRDILILVYGYVQGLAANLERETEDEANTGLTWAQWANSQQPTVEAVAASGCYPTFSALTSRLPEISDRLDLDELFEFGLPLLLDGVAALVNRRWTAKQR